MRQIASNALNQICFRLTRFFFLSFVKQEMMQLIQTKQKLFSKVSVTFENYKYHILHVYIIFKCNSYFFKYYID